MSKNPISEHVGEIVGYVKSYALLQTRLAKLELAERLSRITSSLVVMMIGFILSLFVLLIFSIGVAIYLGDLWNSYPLGFATVSGFFMLVVAILFTFRQSIVVNPLLTLIIDLMTKDDDDEQD